MTERLADVSDMEKGRGGIIAAAILPRFNVHTTRNGQRSGRASEGGRTASFHTMLALHAEWNSAGCRCLTGRKE